MAPVSSHWVRLSRSPDGDALVAALGDMGPVLADYLRAQRWFGSKGRTVGRVAVIDSATLRTDGVPCALALLEVGFTEGPAEVYLLPVAARRMTGAGPALEYPGLARLTAPDGEWVLDDALDDRAVCEALLRRLENAERVETARGAFTFERTPVLSQATGGVHPVPLREIRRIRGEQSNTSVVYDERLVLKVFRRPAAGENPDLEISRFLTLKTRFRNVPLLAGFARYVGPDGARTVAVLHTFVPNQGDAWTWTLAGVRRFYAEVQSRSRPATPGEVMALASTLAEVHVASARRLGEVTGELHAALARDAGDPAFAPEAVTRADLEVWGAAIEAQVREGLVGLRVASHRAAPGLMPTIGRVLAAEATIHPKVTQLGRLSGVPLWKTRVHGDYHLGQVLRVAGARDDFVILDFEGEPARPLEARRAKQSPLRDVAGMLRSFTYASYAGIFEMAREASDVPQALEPWRAAWERVVLDAFLEGYLAATAGRGASFVPASRDVLTLLLDLFCLERAGYELHYELNNRPAWLRIPLATLERALA